MSIVSLIYIFLHTIFLKFHEESPCWTSIVAGVKAPLNTTACPLHVVTLFFRNQSMWRFNDTVQLSVWHPISLTVFWALLLPVQLNNDVEWQVSKNQNTTISVHEGREEIMSILFRSPPCVSRVDHDNRMSLTSWDWCVTNNNKEASRLYAELCEPMLKFFILVSHNDPDR